MIIIIIYPLVDYFLNFLINSFFVVLLYAHTRTSFFVALLYCFSEIYVNFPFSFLQYISLSMTLCTVFSDFSKFVVTLFPSSSHLRNVLHVQRNMMLFLQFSFHYTYKYNIFPFQNHFHLILNTVSLQLFSVFYYMQLFDPMLTKFSLLFLYCMYKYLNF